MKYIIRVEFNVEDDTLQEAIKNWPDLPIEEALKNMVEIENGPDDLAGTITILAKGEN